jgi:hypothetical protein
MTIESKIERMSELYPRWLQIVNECMIDAHIHGWKPDEKDSKILSEFGQLMKDLGITKHYQNG